MAYFLPSYFQKRLLRYALTRLDIIDTEALDLDDLDIKFGQRSVVELKNVGIQVNKLIEKLQIPSNIVLKHALIRLLRVTVPADLHISGILVSVEGIDIHVELQEQDNDSETGGHRLGHEDVISRPGVSSSSVHGPGGNNYGEASEHLIPTSQDLAKSFLDSESKHGRAELEAALNSQSQHMSDSIASLDESGLGDPGGFSLPGFVANFFAGVADRLAVEILQVEVTLGLPLSSDKSVSENVKFMMKIAKLSLSGMQRDSDKTSHERRVEVTGFEVLLLSEREAFSQHSTSSSPRLARSRSKASSTPGSESFSQFESPETNFPLRSHKDVDIMSSDLQLDPEHVSSSASPSDINRSETTSRLSSQILKGSEETNSLSESQTIGQSRHSVDNREHAERLVGSLGEAMPEKRMSASAQVTEEDLTESRMFSHEEAESMYLSAVGDAFEMPGAWASDTKSSQKLPLSKQSPVPPTQASRVLSDSAAGDIASASLSTSKTSDLIREPNGYMMNILGGPFSNLVAKRLVSVNSIKITLPAGKSETSQNASGLPSTTTSEEDRHASTSTYHDMGRSTPQSLHNMKESFASTSHGQTLSRGGVQPSMERQPALQYIIDIGSLACFLDMSVARLLIGAIPSLKRLAPSDAGQNSENVLSQDTLSTIIRIQEAQFKVCQSVAEVAPHPTEADSTTCLIRLSLRNIHHQLDQDNSKRRQKVTIEQIELGQSASRVLYFVDSMNVRDSVATSTMIRKHDLVVSNVDDRFDVQFKPVHLVLDLLLIDEILSRGGGLDSLLDIGASALSSGTIRDTPTNTQTSQRPRSVRFNNSLSRSSGDDKPVSGGPKIDVRISGTLIELVGSETSLQFKTSAIKVVSRSKMSRIQIDNAAILGPLRHGSRTSADINVKLVNTTIIYTEHPSEEDLDRLLSLLTPSNDKYDEDDDIMVDTLIRQRRKGGVLQVSTTDIQINVRGIAWLDHVARIGDELSKLSAVSKYLPEDDRPGILTFVLVNKVGLKIDLGTPFGFLYLNAALIEGAHISVPSLMAAQASGVSLRRGEKELLVTEVIPNTQNSVIMGPPMIMLRLIADEMEPTFRVKLSNTQIEYSVATVVAVEELLKSFQKSSHQSTFSGVTQSSEISLEPSEGSEFARKMRFSLTIRSSTIGLNPTGMVSKGLFLLSDSSFHYSSKQNAENVQLDLRKASILIINDISRLGNEAVNVDHKLYFEENDQVQDLTKAGYVPVGSISNASASVQITKEKDTKTPLVDVEFRNNLLLLETCADSTQTLVQILTGLSPPSAPSSIAKYRTEIVPIQDMLASFTGNAFVTEPGPELGLQASQLSAATSEETHEESDDLYDDYDEDRENYADEPYDEDENSNAMLGESYMDSELSRSRMTGSIHVAPVNLTADDESMMGESIMAHSMLDFRTDHFDRKSSVGGTAHRWDSTRNTYELGTEDSVQGSPLKVKIRDVHIIWNLFDGYDWQSTRDTITQAVQDIEAKALLKQTNRDSRRSPGVEDDESVIGDFLFNSIYIGIPAHKDAKDLTNAINQDIGDLASETGSYATGTTVTATPSNRASWPRAKQKKLRLNRSRQHKMTFELRGVSADVLVFPPDSGEVESSIDVRVKMLEIFDHVPTSTWKKFATYMSDAGEREVDTSMIHLELLNVKPIADLAASEIVLKLTVLPLRLHVDQDALDFMTRFFEFKDDSVPSSDAKSVPPFIQRAEVNPIKLRLDFKPKRVDYAGLRSGRTTEFMNFFTLERSNMVLRRVILYGVSGFDRLGLILNDIWSPDVRRNQLPGVLAGLAPIRSLVDVGSGVKDLVAVPIREYKKDGRIVRSIQKGALAFAKTTTTELVNLGAKLAIGTQTVLQSAEEILVAREQNEDEETQAQISHYADQPLGIVQGLRGAYASLERDLLLAKDAIVAVPGEVMASGSATGAAKAVLKQSPTIILRPAMGVTKAVGQTLLGAGNTLDKRNLRRIEDKYKRH